jgi:hypothetical protein
MYVKVNSYRNGRLGEQEFERSEVNDLKNIAVNRVCHRDQVFAILQHSSFTRRKPRTALLPISISDFKRDALNQLVQTQRPPCTSYPVNYFFGYIGLSVLDDPLQYSSIRFV